MRITSGGPSIGYKIGLELMVRGEPRRIDEVPITFHLRQHGRSKLSMRQRAEYVEHVARLYAFRYSPRRRA